MRVSNRKDVVCSNTDPQAESRVVSRPIVPAVLLSLLSFVGAASADVLSRNAVLSGDLATEATPVTYAVDFGVRFDSVSDVYYFLVFGEDLLDPGECWEVTAYAGDPGGGGCNFTPAPQTSWGRWWSYRYNPEVCNAFLDGVSGGQIIALIDEPVPGLFGAVNVASLTVTIYGQVTPNVGIDIKPGDFPNAVNPAGQGTIPVAILSAGDFDACRELAAANLTFGRTGDEASLAFCSCGDGDSNGDGLPDLLCHFRTPATGFQRGDTQGILKGETAGGRFVKGRDSVSIVRPN